jgi:NADPH:quinone reductase-like Zn-dependent oxidoreductase
MRAIVWTAYGAPDVLRLREIARPTPADDEVLVRVRAATVTAGDCEFRALDLPLLFSLPMRAYAGVLRPKRIQVLGQEFSGIVEMVGKHVQRFEVGDEVFGITGPQMGTYAEYLCRPASSRGADGALTDKPPEISFEEAAAIPLGGLEALHYLEAAKIQEGQHVLILGAGGSIGTMAVQLAKHLGAKVTAVDRAEKLEMLRSIGADHVVDYMRTDAIAESDNYDVIFDVVGKTPIAQAMRSLRAPGVYLMANPRISKMIRAQFARRGSLQQLVTGGAVHSSERLDQLKKLVVEGTLRVVIDRSFPLEETAEAHRFVETGRKTGNVIITIGTADG